MEMNFFLQKLNPYGKYAKRYDFGKNYMLNIFNLLKTIKSQTKT